MLAVGSIMPWARDNLIGAVETRGTDLLQGLMALALGVAAMLLLVALRWSGSASTRRLIGLAILVAGLIATGIALWTLATAEDAFRAEFIEDVARLAGVDLAQAEELVDQTGIVTRTQAGLWLALAGGALTAVGGLLDLAWVGRGMLEAASPLPGPEVAAS